MGKGGGCKPSKKRSPRTAIDVHDPPDRKIDSPTPAENQSVARQGSASSAIQVIRKENQSVASQGSASSAIQVIRKENQSVASQGSNAIKVIRKVKIFIVFYSMYGHVELLARRIKKGVDSIDGVEGFLYRVPETLPRDVLDQMRVPQKGNEVPVIGADDLVDADGLLFGFPTRFGSMASQMMAFFDSMSPLWDQKRLVGVPAGFFVSTGTQGGGQETTAWTAITQLAHHGMIYVPIGYTFGAGMFKMDFIRGGSPYGAGVFSGDGTREPSETELALAEHQGKYMAATVKRFA